MTKKLVWRLPSQPTVDEVSKLIESGVLKKEEAREIILREEEAPKKATPSEIDDVKKEIELLRDIVIELSKSQRNTIIPIVYKAIHEYPAWRPTVWTTYCSSTGTPQLGINS